MLQSFVVVVSSPRLAWTVTCKTFEVQNDDICATSVMNLSICHHQRTKYNVNGNSEFAFLESIGKVGRYIEVMDRNSWAGWI